jgi:guanine deaminase
MMLTPTEKERFLRMAIDEAIAGARAGKGGPFGAVVAREGQIVSVASNAVIAKNDPTAHAEIEAIRSACVSLQRFQLTDCDVFASCEPCPMCLGALFWARPRAVYFAATRLEAARAGFDDARFYEELQHPGGILLPREQVHLAGADEPFSIYAELVNRVTY